MPGEVEHEAGEVLALEELVVRVTHEQLELSAQCWWLARRRCFVISSLAAATKQFDHEAQRSRQLSAQLALEVQWRFSFDDVYRLRRLLNYYRQNDYH